MMEIYIKRLLSIKNNGTDFDEPYIWKVFIQITLGLKALHELSIMHRDLKSANVFLNSDGSAKLGDMNVSKLTDMKGLNYTQTGTPYYASPEVWKDQPYNVKSDIWSLGCVLYEMITLKPPFRASNMEGLFKKVSKGLYQPIPKKYSLELSNLVRSLLKANPDKRPTCDEILRMPSVKKKANAYFPESTLDLESNELLKTIVFPKNLMYLTDQLPTPCYDEDESNEFNESIKASTLPHKKASNKRTSSKLLSRSKKSSGTRGSMHDNEYEYAETISKSSKSRKSRDKSQIRQIMNNNLAKASHQELLKRRVSKQKYYNDKYVSIDSK